MLVTKKILMMLFALSIMTGMIIFIASSSIAQKVDKEKSNTSVNVSEKTLKSEPVIVITDFWRYSKEGNLELAASLRTREYKGITVGLKKDRFYREWEELIYDSEMTLISVDQVEVVATDKWEVAIKVKKKQGKEFYLIHTVVKKNNEWKILRISY